MYINLETRRVCVNLDARQLHVNLEPQNEDRKSKVSVVVLLAERGKERERNVLGAFVALQTHMPVLYYKVVSKTKGEKGD